MSAPGKDEAVLEPKLELRGKFPLVLFAPEVLEAVWRVREEHQVPIRRLHQRFDFGRRHAGRVRPGNQPAHAGADDVVNRNVVFLEPFEHADVGDAAGAAAAERQADSRPGPGLGAIRLRSSRRRYDREDQGEQNDSIQNGRHNWHFTRRATR